MAYRVCIQWAHPSVKMGFRFITIVFQNRTIAQKFLSLVIEMIQRDKGNIIASKCYRVNDDFHEIGE